MAAVGETSGWCYRCYGHVLLRRARIDHLLHLRLSVVTVVCWPLIWVRPAQIRQPWRCSACGSARITTHERTILQLMQEKRYGTADHYVEWV